MKLSDWAKKQGISYLTAYRWFQGGKLPVEAYQSESGTIIIKDEPDALEKSMINNQSNDSMSLFLKKTVEFSKNNASVEDFAAYVLSNFSLKLNNTSESSPKYSKNKPKPEDVQKHFQKFLKPKGEGLKPEPRMFITDSNILEQLGINEEAGAKFSAVVDNIAVTNATSQDIQALVSDLTHAISSPDFSNVTTYDSLGEYEGVVSRNVLNTQPTNYTSSTNSSLISPAFSGMMINSAVTQPAVTTLAYTPSSKEVEVAHEAANKLASDIRSTVTPKRGRKPSKKVESK